MGAKLSCKLGFYLEYLHLCAASAQWTSCYPVLSRGNCQEFEQWPAPSAGCCYWDCSPAALWMRTGIRMRLPWLYFGQDGFVYPTGCWSSLAIARESSPKSFGLTHARLRRGLWEALLHFEESLAGTCEANCFPKGFDWIWMGFYTHR